MEKQNDIIIQDNFYKILGAKIREERLKRLEEDKSEYTLDKLADRMDLTKASISAMERGEQQVSVYQLYRLGHLLNVPLENFLNDIKFSPSVQLLKNDSNDLQSIENL